MSELGAINSSNIAFGKKAEEAEKTEAKALESVQAGKKESITAKLTQPVRDEFHKAYGEDAEATPSLVADFVADNVIKVGVALAGGALILAKARKSTNGLTQALKENFTKLRTATDGKQKVNIVSASIKAVKGAFSDVKANNIKTAAKSVEEAARSGQKSITTSIKEAILQPKDFNSTSKLGQFIDKHLGKNADMVKGALGKIGIADGADVANTAIAAGSTYVLSAGANKAAETVTSEDNGKLARQSKVEQIEGALNALDKLGSTLDMIAG